MPDKTIISIGDSYRLFGSSVQTHDELPVKTYTVKFSQMEGYSLEQTDDLEIGEDKVYGGRQKKVDKVLSAYAAMDRGMGVMLSGDKGQGKSLFLRMLAKDAMDSGLPVVRVTQAYPGLADFIDSLGECVVVFDEFEKVFPSRHGDEASQNQFLSLFDGASSTKRMYCITVNDVYQVSSYLLNRPGRFHYHLRFEYPSAEDVREYLGDQVSDITEDRLTKAVQFAGRVHLNYDHLRAIAFEFNHNADQPLAEIIEDLNIKPMGEERYDAEIFMSNGNVFKSRIEMELFGEPEDEYLVVTVPGGKGSFRVSFNTSDVHSGEGNTIVIHKDDIILNNYDAYSYFEENKGIEVERIEMTIAQQTRYSYGAF